jgi:hypothetical protein
MDQGWLGLKQRAGDMLSSRSRKNAFLWNASFLILRTAKRTGLFFQ